MSKYIVALFSILFIGAVASKKDQTVKPNMDKMYSHFQNLVLILIDGNKFEEKRYEKDVDQDLNGMIGALRNVKGSKELNHSTLEISRDTLERHLVNIQSAFDNGSKNFARWQLNSTLPLCMSCHTQTPTRSLHWNFDEKKTAKLSDFQKAELLFMGRDFDGALKKYDNLIDGFPKNKLESVDLETAVKRKIVIFARVRRDFDGGIASLEANLKNKSLPLYLQKDLKAWTALFRIQKRDGYPDPKTSSDTDIKKYAEKTLSRTLWDDMVDAENPILVKNLTLSGILYEYLDLHPKTSIKPDILNWLAICERELQDTLFYSLADLYLIQCMSEFTTHPTAKKCYQEYKENMILSYSGSSGIHLPIEVKKDLYDWSMKIFGKDMSHPDD